jgi:hypothetical protein
MWPAIDDLLIVPVDDYSFSTIEGNASARLDRLLKDAPDKRSACVLGIIRKRTHKPHPHPLHTPITPHPALFFRGLYRSNSEAVPMKAMNFPVWLYVRSVRRAEGYPFFLWVVGQREKPILPVFSTEQIAMERGPRRWQFDLTSVDRETFREALECCGDDIVAVVLDKGTPGAAKFETADLLVDG